MANDNQNQILDEQIAVMDEQKAPVKRMLGLENRLYQIETNSKTKVWNLVVPPGLPLYFLKNERIFNFFFQFFRH